MLPRREIPGGFVSCAFPFPCIPPGMARRVITTCTRWKLFGCTSKIHRRASRPEQIAWTRAHDFCPTVFSVITREDDRKNVNQRWSTMVAVCRLEAFVFLMRLAFLKFQVRCLHFCVAYEIKNPRNGKNQMFHRRKSKSQYTYFEAILLFHKPYNCIQSCGKYVNLCYRLNNLPLICAWNFPWKTEFKKIKAAKIEHFF